MGTPWCRRDPRTGTLTLSLHVQPGAKRTEVAGLHGDALKLRLAAPPAEGQANAELVRLLAEVFGVPQRQVRVLRGEKSRAKQVAIEGSAAGPEALFRP